MEREVFEKSEEEEKEDSEEEREEEGIDGRAEEGVDEVDWLGENISNEEFEFDVEDDVMGMAVAVEERESRRVSFDICVDCAA